MNDGGPAFPTPDFYEEKLICCTGGMSLRDYFAAKALSAGWSSHARGSLTPENAAASAYEFADAMLAERAK